MVVGLMPTEIRGADNDRSPRNLDKLVKKPVMSLHKAFETAGSGLHRNEDP
jgi:hypothetical protein